MYICEALIQKLRRKIIIMKVPIFEVRIVSYTVINSSRPDNLKKNIANTKISIFAFFNIHTNAPRVIFSNMQAHCANLIQLQKVDFSLIKKL